MKIIKESEIDKPKFYTHIRYGVLRVIYYNKQLWCRLEDIARIFHYSVKDTMKVIIDGDSDTMTYTEDNVILLVDNLNIMEAYVSHFALIDILIDYNLAENCNIDYLENFQAWIEGIRKEVTEPKIKALPEIIINGVVFKEIDSYNFPKSILDNLKIININGVNYVLKTSLEMSKEQSKAIREKFKEILDIIK